MPTFKGCVQAKEISLCPKSLGGGANPHAHVLVLKSLGGGADPKTETPKMPTQAEMDAAAQTVAINKAALMQTTALARMDDVTKAYWLGLDGADAQLAFLEKSAEDQKTEADAAKAAADKKALEEAAAKSGTTPQVLALEKSNGELQIEVAALKAKQVTTDLEKRADTEFKGYPGGSAVVVPLLRAYSTLDQPAREASEAVLKSVAAATLQVTRAFAGRTEADVSKAETAKARIDKAVKELAASAKISEGDAYERVIGMAEFADDIAALDPALTAGQQ